MTTKTSAASPHAPSTPAEGSPAGGDIAQFKDAHQILNHTYLSGVYFLVNAVPDVALLFDGPSCGYDKAFLVSGTHDLFSRLFQFPARHRVNCTHVQADALVHDRTDKIAEVLGQLCSTDSLGLILVTGMPMASITGIDYQGIIDGMADAAPIPIALVPEKSFRNDWLAGYDDVLGTLVEQLIEKRPSTPNRENVTVMGYLLDRHEGDHAGNIAELHRACEALSLKLVSVWLDGSPTTELAKAAEAGTIVSLPYGRQAAHKLAERTGAQIVELDLPIGLAASKSWVNALGAATGRRWEASQFIERELGACVPVLDTVIADYLQGRRLAFSGDPFLGEAVMAAFSELGASTEHRIIFGVQSTLERLERRRFVGEGNTLYCARVSDLLELDWSEIDCVIGNSYVHYVIRLCDARKPYVEMGFPSYQHHFLTKCPYWFFRGFVELCNRVVNAI